MSRENHAHPGQGLVEYALLIAIVAVVVIPATIFLRDTTAATYLRHQSALSEPTWAVATEDAQLPAPLPTATATAVPTATPEPYTTPTTTGECRNGGWRNFNPPGGPFNSQSECISYVNAIDEPPAETYTVPSSRADCRNGGWRNFNPPGGPFRNQSACIDYVNNN